MSIQPWKIALLAALIVVLAAGGAYLYKSSRGGVSEISPEPAEGPVREMSVKKRYEAKRALYSEFEAALNGFIQELDKEAHSYKSLRKVYMDLVAPVHLRAPEFVVENYNLGVRTNMELQLQMEKIVSMFTNTDIRMRNLIARLPDDEGERAIQKWALLQSQQAEPYLQFFTADQDIFQKVQKLLEFYYIHRSDMTIDVVKNEIIFSEPEYQAEAFRLQNEIEVLKKAQAAMIKAGV